jgi:MFS family permease
MTSSFLSILNKYPRQFWLMFVGMLISTIGTSMIWPFLMIYASSKLDLPLTNIAFLLTINSAFGFASSLISGPIIDRLGRKWMMVFSLVSNGMVYLFLSQANSYETFAILMALSGSVNPLYRVGTDAMLADLIPEDKRIDAYALLRLSNNLGIALGPAIGGLLATTSYTYAFLGATVGMTSYGLLLTFFAKETLPKSIDDEQDKEKEFFGGYPKILKDAPFRNMLLAFFLVSMGMTLIWTLMGVHAKNNYGMPESQYGLIATTNAIMVVTLQISITNITKRHLALPVMAIGAALYTIATGSVSLMTSFWGFWLSMVIMTFGELILVPTASTFVANLAPVDKRGRYMGLFGLTWPVAAGIAPIMGGLLNDNMGPQYIWIGGAFVCSFSIFVFWMMHRNASLKTNSQVSSIDTL